MLDRSEITYIGKNFGVYDQEWRFYRGFLGEPHIISDCLVYFDGRILYICCFPLSDPYQELPLARLEEILTRFVHAPLEGINLWGRLPIMPSEMRLPQGTAKLSHPVDLEYDQGNREHIIDLHSVDHTSLPKARKSLRRAERAGVSARVVTREYLSAAHITILRRFIATHNISPVHAASYLSIQQLLHEPVTRIVECYVGDVLVGFRVVLLSGMNAGASICGFHNPLARGASDIGMACTLDYCREQGVAHLHLGYSGTPSLAWFKEKWGAVPCGPPYKEAFYYLTEAARLEFERGEFLWRDNLYMGVVRNTTPSKDE